MDEGDEAEAAEGLLPPRRRYYAGIDIMRDVIPGRPCCLD